jgi:rare lipoprotein A
MQKSINKYLVFLSIATIFSSFTLYNTIELQQKPKQKKFQKKETKKTTNKETKKIADPKIKLQLDSIKKDNTTVAQKDIVIDTVATEKGKFKIFKEKAHASYYGDRFHGRRTASGRIYDMHKLTAAHKKLPFGTKVKVTNVANGKSVIVEITDRGPFVRGREIDLSKKAFFTIASSSGAGYIITTLEVLEK